MSSRSQAMRPASSGLRSAGSAQGCSYNGLGCLKTPLYGRHKAASPILPSRGTYSIQCCSHGLPRRPFRNYQVQRKENNFQEHDKARQAPQGKLHRISWLQTLKPALLAGMLTAMAFMVVPSAQASWLRKRRVEPQHAQVQTAKGWLAPAAASLQSARHTASQAAHAADRNVVKPVIQQTQNTAAGTKRWIQSVIGNNERVARGPVHQNMTIEEHLQQSMESPAVRILVTVGAVSVLLLLVRTSMEEPVKKRFSPMDSDDWTDDREAHEGEEGGAGGYPRAPATFSGSAAEAAATLAARADAIADKADNMRGSRPAPVPIPTSAVGTPAPLASPSQFPSAEGLPNVEAVAPSAPPEVEHIAPARLPEPVPVEPAEMPDAGPVVGASAVTLPQPAASPAPTSGTGASTAGGPGSSGQAPIKEVLPAGSLEAFASNRKLREQLEEVRNTVAHAKAQVAAADDVPKAQVREALAERASRLQEQQQLPVFKIATLEGSPVDYQTRLRSPTAERKAPVVRFETSQGDPVKPPKPAKSGNSALRFPWQPKGDARVPLPSPPQRTSPAHAVSIATEPATREGKLEARAVERQVKETDEFLRRKGSEAPAVVALGFLSAAASAFAPLLVGREEAARREHEAQLERQRWKNLSAAEKELDWQRYGKYDALQQVLTSAASEPSFKPSDRSPAKAVVDAIPKRGRPKYDALRQLAQDLITTRHGAEASDPLWNLLHMAKEKQAKGTASQEPNPIFEWLNRAAAAADWGLPEAGPAAALLRLDASDWEPPGYCPVYDVLKSARAGGAAPWHNNIRSSQDPLTGLFALQAPTGVSKFDPMAAAVRAEASAVRSRSDPLGVLLDYFQGRSSAKADVPELPSILPSEPPRPSDTPVAALNRAADAIAQSASESTSTTTVTATGLPASPAGSGASALSQPAAATGASAITQQAALQSGAGSVTSQRGQGWLRAMWNRSTGSKPKQAGTASLNNSAAVAAPGSTTVDAGGPTVQPQQPSAAEAQTQSLAEGLKGAQQALQNVRQGGPSGSTSTRGKPKQARAGVYNPLPDLLRLERGRDTPIGSACDHISVMLRRDSDFGPVAAAFKEMAADEKLGKDYWPLFSLMRRAAAAPLLAFPGNGDEGSLEGLNEVTVAEASKTAKSLVAELNTPHYKPLHTLLSNRRSMDVVEGACAMAIIVQPFDKP